MYVGEGKEEGYFTQSCKP